MKRKFSNSWISSKQVRKQRKYRYNAPLHRKRRFLSAPLSKELRKDYGKRSLVVKKGDEVVYGKYSGSEVDVDTTKYFILRESDILAIVE